MVELKWDKSAAGAISQIKEKEYCQSLEEYQGNLLLVGINYDVKTKEHSCVIEEFVNRLTYCKKKERKCPFKGIHSLLFGKIPLKHNFSFVF